MADALDLGSSEETRGGSSPPAHTQLFDGIQFKLTEYSCMAVSLERVRKIVAQREPIVDNWEAEGLLLMGDPLQRIVEAVTPMAGRSMAR